MPSSYKSHKSNKALMMSPLKWSREHFRRGYKPSKAIYSFARETLTCNFRYQEGLALWTMGNKRNLARVKGIKAVQPYHYPYPYTVYDWDSVLHNAGVSMVTRFLKPCCVWNSLSLLKHKDHRSRLRRVSPLMEKPSGRRNITVV